MDLMTVIGLLVSVGAVYYTMWAGGIVALLFNFDAAILVFGGTLGATMITYPWQVLSQTPKAMMIVLFPKKRLNSEKMIQLIVRLTEKAKINGIQSLQSEFSSINDKFLKDGLQMIIDGLDEDIVRDNLNKELVFTQKRHQEVASVFRAMGTYAPIFGLLGTLIGVVQVLRDISDVKSLGASMAIAVTTTFYGIFGTNFAFLPIAGKLSSYSDEEMLLKEVMIEGILSIQNGDIPIIVSKKLQAYLSGKYRKSKSDTMR